MIIKAVKAFCSIVNSLGVPHNYFDGPIKLFSDFYLAKFLDFSKTVLSVQEASNSFEFFHGNFVRW